MDNDLTDDKTRTAQFFEDWFSGSVIYVGYNRYGYEYGHGFVCATAYYENETLQNIIENLDAGDLEASEQIDALKAMPNVWFGVDENPVIAMDKMHNKIKNYFFYELNNAPKVNIDEDLWAIRAYLQFNRPFIKTTLLDAFDRIIEYAESKNENHQNIIKLFKK